MRGASPVDHNLGGVHISGAECITHESMIKEAALNLIHRALNHPKGKSDFINISIQKIHEHTQINYIPPLPITTLDKNENELYPNLILEKIGFSKDKIQKTLNTLLNLKNLKGALIISFDDFFEFRDNIVRCTNMDYDISIKNELNDFLIKNNFNGKYLKEALCLSSKICNEPNVLCEVCISDDKNYTTGYISSKSFGYVRIENFKPINHDFGGRIIFIKDKLKLNSTIEYLKNSVVLINSIPKINSNCWWKNV